ncbi:MAG: mechanosensitive ion channel [Chloroflexi bacterium]|nr:mechanosensitive ion channel [Chloroflexota bacterium]MBP8055580.1 mechanosensitive ion channel [Chloroflexota bacterium]
MSETLRALFFRFSGIDINAETFSHLLNSLAILLLLWLARVLIMRLVHRRYAQDTRALYNWRKGTQYTLAILGLILVGRIWLVGVHTIATYLGLVSAGLAIALQDVLVNLAGWFFIIWRKPFQVGDRIEIEGFAGDVIDIRLFEFALLEIGKRIQAEQSTGRIIHVPNGKVFSDVFVNYTQGLPLIWHEIPIVLTFESAWEKAKTLLGTILTEYAPDVDDLIRRQALEPDQRFVISYGNTRPTVYTKVVSNGVLLTLRYLIDPRQVRNNEQQIWEAILRTFAAHTDIDFAYDTVREFVHWREGKPASLRRQSNEDPPSSAQHVIPPLLER